MGTSPWMEGSGALDGSVGTGSGAVASWSRRRGLDGPKMASSAAANSAAEAAAVATIESVGIPIFANFVNYVEQVD